MGGTGLEPVSTTGVGDDARNAHVAPEGWSRTEVPRGYARGMLSRHCRHARYEMAPDGVEAAVYYPASESLTNSAKHADATGVTIRMRASDGALEVEIADDGKGGGADLAAGTGLRGLADRVEALGGRLALASPTGAGTKIRATLPLERH